MRCRLEVLWILAAVSAVLSFPGAHAADTPPSDSAAVPATRYYPLGVGTQWKYDFHRTTHFNLSAKSGPDRQFGTDTAGVQTVEILHKDDERSGEHGPVVVQRTSERGHAVGSQAAAPDSDKQHLVSDAYLRVNARGIWLIADGEPDESGQSIATVHDRRRPGLWLPAGLQPKSSWVITCQIDPQITARVTATTGAAQTLKVNGATYEGCIPVLSVADHLEGRLDVGVGLAPITDGRMIDLTWYAPKVGAVKSHQLANFDLSPPTAAFNSAHAHFEETESLQPGPKTVD